MGRELELTTSFWGLKAYINENTRINPVGGYTRGSCIDNIFSNSDAIDKSMVERE